MHLVCFGDSICYGYGARPGEGWVAQMTRMLATLREPVAVTNAGVSGDTTEDGLRRMQWDVERHHPNAVFVQFGPPSKTCTSPSKNDISRHLWRLVYTFAYYARRTIDRFASIRYISPPQRT